MSLWRLKGLSNSFFLKDLSKGNNSLVTSSRGEPSGVNFCPAHEPAPIWLSVRVYSFWAPKKDPNSISLVDPCWVFIGSTISTAKYSFPTDFKKIHFLLRHRDCIYLVQIVQAIHWKQSMTLYSNYVIESCILNLNREVAVEKPIHREMRYMQHNLNQNWKSEMEKMHLLVPESSPACAVDLIFSKVACLKSSRFNSIANFLVFSSGSLKPQEVHQFGCNGSWQTKHDDPAFILTHKQNGWKACL
jgi:hypothetical protein